jgi:hypothetical protein
MAAIYRPQRVGGAAVFGAMSGDAGAGSVTAAVTASGTVSYTGTAAIGAEVISVVTADVSGAGFVLYTGVASVSALVGATPEPLPIVSTLSYDTLKADIAAWLDRTDLTAQIPSFVRLVEARIARDVRVGLLSTSSTLTILAGQSSVALPANCVEIRGVAGRWRFMTPAAMRQAAIDGCAEYVYTVEGGAFKVPAPVGANTTVVVTCYTTPNALESGVGVNLLYQANPGLYLFGALAEASVFLSNDNRAPLWEAKYRKSLEELRAADAGISYSVAEMPGWGVV